MNSRFAFLKTILPEVILAAAFLFTIAVTMMSAYTLPQLFVKIIFAAVTLTLLLSIRKIKPSELRSDKGLRSIVTLFSVIFIYFSITLIYTSNFQFGLQKTFHFLVLSIVVITFYIYLKETTDENLKIALYTVAGICITFIVLALIISPFVYTSKYAFSINRWSHILSGRVIAGISVLFMLLLISGKEIINQKFNWIFLTAMMFGLSYIGSRLSTITVGITIVIILFYLIAQKKIATPVFYKVASLLLLLIIFMVLLPKTNESAVERYDFLLEISKDKVEDMIDGAMKSRISGYRTALIIVTQHPILGKGIGGFKDDPNYYLTSYLQYPHNIFLEVASEFGLPALLIFLVFLSLLIYKSYKQSPLLLIFLIFGLILAQFSKDIPTQTFLWISVMMFFTANPRE